MALIQIWLIYAAASIAAVTVYLCGDSTMADSTPNGHGLEALRVGWGESLKDKMKGAKVVNLARVGASVRTYTKEGRFDEVAELAGEGDWVILQFGHNELGSTSQSDKAALPGIGSEEKTITNLQGQTETILTFGGYMRAATEKAKNKGARILILSQTPEVEYLPSKVAPRPASRFVQYASDIAHQTKGYHYIDHYQIFADYLTLLGQTDAAPLFYDNRHMTKAGADHAAELFLQALRESTIKLRDYIDAPEDKSKQSSATPKVSVTRKAPGMMKVVKRSKHLSTNRDRGHRKRTLASY